MAGQRIDFYWDPGCPWAYLTSVWARYVADARDMHVRWRPFSLRLKNAPPGDEPPPAGMSDRCLRVALAAHEAVGGGDDADLAVGRLYAEMGSRRHRPEREDIGTDDALRSILGACGLDPELAKAADDDRWDARIRSEMDAAIGVAGDNVGVPIIALDGGEGPGWFGPVISRVPQGDAALKLWDAFETLARVPGFYEIKRGRTERPQIPG